MGSTPLRRRRLTTVAAALAMLVGTALGSAPIAQADDQRDGAAPARAADADITMVQANIYTGLSTERFQKDVATVLGLRPDFVTYNEVPFRNNAVMAPAGYAIYRDMTDRFTAATPVAWRTDRWTATDHGSFMLSNWRGKPPGRVVEIGRRWANWVTLEGVDGRVVSVVSVHVAPTSRGMPDLLRRSVKRLGILVEKLAPAGPVLVGGDFNVHYRSGRYPRDLIAADGLVPTYDSMGAYFATGDHHGYTIDYIFDSQPELLAPVRQYPVELNSDHDAVVADLSWTTDDEDPQTTVVVSQPSAGGAAQRAVVARLSAAIRSAEPGSTVRFATSEFGLGGLTRYLRRAVARGVHLQVTTANNQPSAQELRLRRVVRHSRDAKSWVHRRGSSCVTTWRTGGVPPSVLMVRDASGAWQARYDVNRKLTRDLLVRTSRVAIRVAPRALARGVAMFRVIDRPASSCRS